MLAWAAMSLMCLTCQQRKQALKLVLQPQGLEVCSIADSIVRQMSLIPVWQYVLLHSNDVVLFGFGNAALGHVTVTAI